MKPAPPVTSTFIISGSVDDRYKTVDYGVSLWVASASGWGRHRLAYALGFVSEFGITNVVAPAVHPDGVGHPPGVEQEIDGVANLILVLVGMLN